MAWLAAETLDPKVYEGRDLRGLCAGCGEAHIVRLCGVCHAVMCDECKKKPWWRTVAGAKAFFRMHPYRGEIWEG